jgi:hypothetical protein
VRRNRHCESFRGKRSALPLKSRKRGGVWAEHGLSAEQIPVIVAHDRRGATTDAVLSKLDRASIAAALGDVTTSANMFGCEEAIVAFDRPEGRHLTQVVSVATGALLETMPEAGLGIPSPTMADFFESHIFIRPCSGGRRVRSITSSHPC